MKNMTKIDPKQIDENVIRLIGSQWMLVTAGNPAHFNTMTASWGGLGFLWNPASGFRVYPAAALYVPVCGGEQRTHALFFRGGVPRRIENMRFALGTGYR